MSNLIVPGKGGAVVDLTRFQAMNAAALAGMPPSYGVVSLAGGRFTIRLPDREPLQLERLVLPVVVVGLAPNLSRTWYARPYQPGSSEEPDCYSLDGLAPSASARNKQAATCASCPYSQWGSARNPDGTARKGQACSQHRRLAVLLKADLSGQLSNGPLLLRVPPASLMRFAQYAQRLSPTPLITVVTEVSFVPGTTGELQFKAGQALTPPELELVTRWYDSQEVHAILYGTTLTELPSGRAAPEPAPAVEAAAPEPEPEPEPEPVVVRPAPKPAGKLRRTEPKPAEVVLEAPMLGDADAEAQLGDELAELLAGVAGR